MNDLIPGRLLVMGDSNSKWLISAGSDGLFPNWPNIWGVTNRSVIGVVSVPLSISGACRSIIREVGYGPLEMRGLRGRFGVTGSNEKPRSSAKASITWTIGEKIVYRYADRWR